MSWHYNLAKQTDDDGYVEHLLIEVYLNEDGDIWGYTEHTDILGYLQGTSGTHEDVMDEVVETLIQVQRDVICRPLIDLDTLITVKPDFAEELEVILGDN